MSFIGRFGNSCGIPFNKNEYCDKHIQWNFLRPYLNDRPSQPWCEFVMSEQEKKTKGGKSRRLLKKRNKTRKK